MLQTVAYLVLAVCWLAWSLAFVEPRKRAAGRKKVTRAPASKWGIFLQALSFAFIWAYVRPPGFEKSAPALIASIVVGPFAVALAWAATRHLGKQWRYEAALIENHELIQSGPYRWVRHPIYASMLGMVLATGAAYTWWPMSLVGLVFFLAGTEIRVRAEDHLLGQHFQSVFISYQARVPAYIPFIH